MNALTQLMSFLTLLSLKLSFCYTSQLGLLRHIRWLLHGTLLTQMLLHRQATTARNRWLFAAHPF
jgi:hypothetical protein